MTSRVRAVIIQDGKVLTIKRVLSDCIYWTFPGGGVEESDDDLKSALKRECLEEVGVNVAVKNVILKKEYKEGIIEYFYICKIINGKVSKGSGPEYDNKDLGYRGTHEPKWLPLKNLDKFSLKPEILRDLIIKNTETRGNITI